jgi:hypothetical protein
LANREGDVPLLHIVDKILDGKTTAQHIEELSKELIINSKYLAGYTDMYKEWDKKPKGWQY